MKRLMKRRQLITGAIALAAAQIPLAHAVAARPKKVTVRNSRELFEAIGSDREIYLEPGLYDLGSLSGDTELSSPHIRFNQVFDGVETIIQNVQNLTLVGPSDLRAKLYARPRYANVLPLENSQEVSLKSLELGHWPDQGYCSGAVVQYTDCDRLSIEDSVLFGSGTYGISALRASTLKCEGTKIHDCTYGILTLRDCVDLQFKDCQLVENQEYSGILATNVRRLSFEECTFADNWFKNEFFVMRGNDPIHLKDCQFSRNSSTSLATQPSLLKLDRVEFTGNSFPVPARSR